MIVYNDKNGIEIQGCEGDRNLKIFELTNELSRVHKLFVKMAKIMETKEVPVEIGKIIMKEAGRKNGNYVD